MTNPDDPTAPTLETGFANGEVIQGFGLTKREYFAALAMQGILANAEGCYTKTNNIARSPGTISHLAVEHADALIQALND